jgi:hypothetical protein
MSTFFYAALALEQPNAQRSAAQRASIAGILTTKWNFDHKVLCNLQTS